MTDRDPLRELQGALDEWAECHRDARLHTQMVTDGSAWRRRLVATSPKFRVAIAEGVADFVQIVPEARILGPFIGVEAVKVRVVEILTLPCRPPR
jgi:hypothetical protein